MTRYFNDEGIVLKKINLLKDDKLTTIFSKNYGKIVLLAKGIRKIISRRLSHLETGNLIKFSFYKKDNFYYLRETEIIYGYSKIKKSGRKLNTAYLIFFILNKILPENQSEPFIYNLTLNLLKKLNNEENFSDKELKNYLNEVLRTGGFINRLEIKNLSFDPIKFIENLINEKIKIAIT
jgi:DNA repair protein RecO